MSKLLVLYPTVRTSVMNATIPMYDSSTKRLLTIEAQATVTEEVGIDRKFIVLSPDTYAQQCRFHMANLEHVL